MNYEDLKNNKVEILWELIVILCETMSEKVFSFNTEILWSQAVQPWSHTTRHCHTSLSSQSALGF